MANMPLRVAILGAECTGKSTLAQALGAALRAHGRTVRVVPEYLRTFCTRAGRTPRPDEQRAILEEQSRQIEAAARSGADVVADTTALVTAAYSHCLFGDDSLRDDALAAHRACSHTLLLRPDLLWQADGLLRDGVASQAPVDAWLAAALDGAGLPWTSVTGSGDERLRRALAALGY